MTDETQQPTEQEPEPQAQPEAEEQIDWQERYRNLQAAFTRASQRASELEAELARIKAGAEDAQPEAPARPEQRPEPAPYGLPPQTYEQAVQLYRSMGYDDREAATFAQHHMAWIDQAVTQRIAPLVHNHGLLTMQQAASEAVRQVGAEDLDPSEVVAVLRRKYNPVIWAQAGIEDQLAEALDVAKSVIGDKVMKARKAARAPQAPAEVPRPPRVEAPRPSAPGAPPSRVQELAAFYETAMGLSKEAALATARRVAQMPPEPEESTTIIEKEQPK